MRHSLRIAVLAASALLGAVGPAHAYPTKPVTIVVPFPAGSQTDMVARIAGAELERRLGKPFVVENKPGASGSIAAKYVADSAPDGSTLLLTTAAIQAMNKSLFKQPSYDPVKDFTPVAQIATTSMMLMTRPDFPADNVEELVALARKDGNAMSAGYGSSGAQIALALFQARAGTDVLAVPYKGIPNAVTDVIGKTITFTFVDAGNALRFQQGKQLKPLAIASARRSRLAPSVPSLSESLKDYNITSWYGLVGPKAMPDSVAQSLAQALQASLADAATVEKLAVAGVEPAYMPPAPFGKHIELEVDNWARLVQLARIEPQ
ncbi:Bug family tripartite tricarboxylate transporter substrate binding protein [Bordetella parapertussis]|uniref:Exported protein n=1 Tax=Bordetella parapertussis (strain Bpp5) TaxID=1208660 RepID=K0MJN6_BORPB|nr:tripartite tricarboxylate transporter substrate binding protein [Bordetella parapertussis]CCJ51625.1 putative exported protein [Bordetella parapertussis Bpp5]